MNTNPNNTNQSQEGIDRLVGEYFHAQMPASWPAAPRPWAEKASISAVPSQSGSRSRWALAASVAVLVGGCWYLSGQLTDGRKRPDTNFDGTADMKHAKDAGKNLPKQP